MPDAKIPHGEVYRGVGIHIFQSPERVRTVKREIDQVHALHGVAALFEFAVLQTNAPESRMFAAAKCEAAWELAAENREARPPVNLVRLAGAVFALDDISLICPYTFGNLIDFHHQTPRQARLTDDEIEAAKTREPSGVQGRRRQRRSRRPLCPSP